MVTDVPYTDVSGKSDCLLVRAILLRGNTTDRFLGTHPFLADQTGTPSPPVFERRVLLLDNIFLFIQISVLRHMRFHLKM